MREQGTSYEVLEAICMARRARRDFSPKPIDAEMIEKILRVAKTSPYASGRKNWEIQVVTDSGSIAKMAEMVEAKVNDLRARIRADFAEEFLTYAENFMSFARAPALFVPTFRVGRTLSPIVEGADQVLLEWERDNYVKSIACVGMLILLAAESLGLAACYMTGPLLAETELTRLLKVKRGRSIAAVIPVGYRTGEN
ncbi:MAG: nitroreductase family protein [Candidatus Thiodiazotropha endolucinida]